MKHIRIWSALVAALLALQAPVVLANPVWTNAAPVTHIEAVQDGTFLVYTSASVSSNCVTASGGLYFQVGANTVTSDGIKTLLTLAMSALVSGKTVQVLYDDTAPTCYAKFIQINQ